jgi:3-keto-5-aminohexanoate cleavage enzyme
LSRGNQPLVERAVRVARALDRPIASVEETEAILRLPKPLSTNAYSSS